MRLEHPCIPSLHPCVGSGEREHPPPAEPSGWARILAAVLGWAACRRTGTGTGSCIPGTPALPG